MYGGYVLAQNSEMRACLYAIHPERPQSRSRSVSLMGKVDDIFWEGENVNNTLTYSSYPETQVTKKCGARSLVIGQPPNDHDQ